MNDPAVVRSLLTKPGTWAVVGLRDDPSRAAWDVAGFLQRTLGMRIVPVHPAAEVVHGAPGYPRLADVPDATTVDVVDLFVRSALAGGVVDEAIAERDRLGIRAVWFQLRVVDDAAAERARAAGLDVVLSACPQLEHPRL